MKPSSRKPAQTTSIAPASGRAIINLSLSGLIVLCAALVVATALSLRFLAPKAGSPAVDPAPSATATAGGMHASSEPEPEWGRLEKVDLNLGQPEEYVAFIPVANPETRWAFPGLGVAEILASLRDCGVPEPLANELVNDRTAEAAGGATVVRPPDEAVLAMSESSREAFYRRLAKSQDNTLCVSPFILWGPDYEEVLEKGGVRQDVRTLVRRLSYVRDGVRYFSDLGIIMKLLSSEDERRALFQALTCQPVVMARMRVGPRSDVDRIIGYWTGMPGVQLKDLKPLLESLHNSPDGGTVSLLYFLPPFARERLYTFPLEARPGEPAMDCHWSTLNFFNATPDDRLADSAYQGEYIPLHYYPIGKASRYGDLVFLVTPDGTAIHSAVYLAEDLVFTKNGKNIGQPWVIMRMANMIARYAYKGESKVLYYRDKRM